MHLLCIDWIFKASNGVETFNLQIASYMRMQFHSKLTNLWKLHRLKVKYEFNSRSIWTSFPVSIFLLLYIFTSVLCAFWFQVSLQSNQPGSYG